MCYHHEMNKNMTDGKKKQMTVAAIIYLFLLRDIIKTTRHRFPMKLGMLLLQD